MKRRDYEKPAESIVRTQISRAALLAGTTKSVAVGSSLKGWNNSGDDSWDDSSQLSVSGSTMGGWTDNGGSAWE